MIKNSVLAIAKKFGYSIEKLSSTKFEEFETDTKFKNIYKKCSPYSMTSIERMFSLYGAVNYLEKNGIAGDFVECGVWKGGSSMVMAETLLLNNSLSRNLLLYDTFEGMAEPTDKDVSISGRQVVVDWNKVKKDEKLFCYSALEEVQENLALVNYPPDNISFIKGKVEDTIPGVLPETIALLRLDTDWFESTYHELVHLYPRLVKGGVLIIDDYGHWQGAKEAVDKYFHENNIHPLLIRIDYTCRIMFKM